MLDNREITNTYKAKGDGGDAWLSHIKQMRADRRGVYSSAEGREILTQMVKDSGLFTDTGEDNARNFVIRLLESMGILDEDNIEKIVRFMLSNTAIIPVSVANMQADKNKK